jgi:hypothetical protein
VPDVEARSQVEVRSQEPCALCRRALHLEPQRRQVDGLHVLSRHVEPGTDAMILKYFHQKKSAKKIGVCDAKHCWILQKVDHNIGFEEKRQHFPENYDHNIDPSKGSYVTNEGRCPVARSKDNQARRALYIQVYFLWLKYLTYLFSSNLTNLKKFQQVWPNFSKFDQISASLTKFQQVWQNFYQVWQNVIKFDKISSSVT